jgi:hypothetical protein
LPIQNYLFMKNYTKALALSGLLIFALNICSAQTTTDSTTVKKTIKQPKSRVYARLELGAPLYFASGNYSTTVTWGFIPSVTVGYSFSKCFRLGGGAEFIYNNSTYLPVFVNAEFGNHTKRVNASLNINTGYSFYIPVSGLYPLNQNSGFISEFLPTISFGSYKRESRFRISLGNQLTVSHRDYPLFEDLYNPNQRLDFSPTKNTVINLNLLLKFGMDF